MEKSTHAFYEKNEFVKYFQIFEKKIQRTQAASFIVQADRPCMYCGSKFVRPLNIKSKPDFPRGLYPDDIIKCLLDKQTGTCLCCGLTQSFRKPTLDQLHFINRIGKDKTTSDETYVTESKISLGAEAFRQQHINTRLKQWDFYFEQKKLTPARVLFLRHWFGDTMQYVYNRFGADIVGVDMSETCVKYVKSHHSYATCVSGEINGLLAGEFLQSGLYDAIFSWHILNHAVDIHTMLRQIDSILAPGGFWLLTHETSMKPHNPFHHFHPGELQLKMILNDHFDHFDIIPECKPSTSKLPANPRGDEADYVVWKRS